MGLAQMGQNSASNLSQVGTNTAAGVRGAYGDMGDAKAQGYGAIGGGLTGLGGAFANWYNGQAPKTTYGGGDQAQNYGLPMLASSYQNTNWGS